MFQSVAVSEVYRAVEMVLARLRELIPSIVTSSRMLSNTLDSPVFCRCGIGRIFRHSLVIFGCRPTERKSSVSHSFRELPDMMSTSEGGGGHGKADVVREVA